MPWLTLFASRLRTPRPALAPTSQVQETAHSDDGPPARKPMRAICLYPRQAGAWIIATETSDGWQALRFAGEAEFDAMRYDIKEHLRGTRYFSPEALDYPDAEFKACFAPADLQAAGLAVKRDVGSIVPRLIFAEADHHRFPDRPRPIAPAPDDAEIWIARQRPDPANLLRYDQWRLKRIWPMATKPGHIALDPDTPIAELSAAVLRRQRGRTAFLFIQQGWGLRPRIPMAACLAVAGITPPALRPAEACVAFHGNGGRRSVCFLAADGTLRAWTADRRELPSSWSPDDGSHDRCLTLTLENTGLEADIGRLVDPEWLAAASSEAAGHAILDALPFLDTKNATRPWIAATKGVEDREGEAALERLAELAARSDPTLMGMTLHIEGRTPGHPLAGYVRFAPRRIEIFAPADQARRESLGGLAASRARLAFLLNLAAIDLKSWSTTCGRLYMRVRGATSAHDLIEATTEMASWWRGNRARVPQGWYRVSPSGAEITAALIDALDRDLLS